MTARRPQFLPAGLLVAVVLILGVLPVLAYASPPDPSWIAGIYDGADYDDVVVLVTLATGHPSLTPVVDLRPDVQVTVSVLPAAERPMPALWLSAVLPRGPPSP